MGDPDPPGPSPGGLCSEIETTLLLLLLLSGVGGGQWALTENLGSSLCVFFLVYACVCAYYNRPTWRTRRTCVSVCAVN